LIAFDKKTGEELWQGGDDMISYGSPAIASILGQEQITLVAESAAVGYDPNDGTVLWKAKRPGNSHMDANTTQVTRISDNRLLLSKGYGLGGEMVELSKSNDGIDVKTLWKSSRVLKTKMMSPVILDGHAYCLSDGFLECCTIGDENEEARRVWRKRGRFGNGQLLLVGDNLLVHTEHGMLKLVKAMPEKYIELGEIKTIDGVCWNTICLYKNFLLVRSELEAACIVLKTEAQTAVAADDTSEEAEAETDD
jgi:outer membrane protein assembly factor BamB